MFDERLLDVLRGDARFDTSIPDLGQPESARERAVPRWIAGLDNRQDGSRRHAGHRLQLGGAQPDLLRLRVRDQLMRRWRGLQRWPNEHGLVDVVANVRERRD